MIKTIHWLKSIFSVRGKALAIYRTGLKKSRSHDPGGAIEAYSRVIDLPGAPLDVISMAVFNRGLVYTANGEKEKGVCDLDAVLAMAAAPARVKTMARQKLLRMKNRPEKSGCGEETETDE